MGKQRLAGSRVPPLGQVHFYVIVLFELIIIMTIIVNINCKYYQQAESSRALNHLHIAK